MRSGAFSLRGQGLRPSLLEVLKQDELDVSLSVPTGSPVKTTDFIEISTRVLSHLGTSYLTTPCPVLLRLMNRPTDQIENHS